MLGDIRKHLIEVARSKRTCIILNLIITTSVKPKF